jgi:uncharacterized membrane protein
VFEIGFEWWRGAGQVLTYSAVIVVILWVMSKIEVKGGGESSTRGKKGKDNE